MVIRCCDCGVFLGEKEPFEDTRETSSFCPNCLFKVKREIDYAKFKIAEIKKGEFYESTN